MAIFGLPTTLPAQTHPLVPDPDHSESPRDTNQTVKRVSGKSFLGTLVGWDDPNKGVFRTLSSTEHSIEMDQLIRYGTTPPTKSRSGLLLIDHSILYGRIVQIDQTTCRLVNPWLDVKVPLPLVRSVLLNAPILEGIQSRLLEFAEQSRGTNDTIVLLDNQQRTGTLAWGSHPLSPLEKETMLSLATMESKYKTQIPLNRIRMIVFNPASRASPAIHKKGDRRAVLSDGLRSLRIGLKNGSLLHCRRVPENDTSGKLIFHLSCGLKIVGNRTRSDGGQIVMVAPMNLPSSMLCTQTPARYRHIPYFGRSKKWTRWDDGRPRATIAGRGYPNGLQVPSSSRMVYLSHGATRLVGSVGMADKGFLQKPDLYPNLGAQFRVLTSDPRGIMVQRWASKMVRPGQKPVEINVDVSQSVAVVLAVEPGDMGDFGDVALWLDLMLLKKEN